MALVTQSLPISREELRKFLPNFQLIKAFENMSQDVSVNLPGGIADQSAAIALAQATADSAIVQATAAQATANGAVLDAAAAQADIDAFELRDVPIALVDAATILVNAAFRNSFSVTLGGNRTLDAPSNLADGMLLNFAIRQDGTGNRTLAFNAIYDFGAVGTPVLSTAANVVDRVFGYYDLASNKILASFRKGGASAVASFSAHNNGTTQNLTNAAFTTLTLGTEDYDVGSKFASNAWTPPAGRLVSMSGNVGINAAAAGPMTIAVFKNGAEFKRGTQITTAAAMVSVYHVSCQDIPNGTDVYDLRAFQQTGALQPTSGASNITYFQGTTVAT